MDGQIDRQTRWMDKMDGQIDKTEMAKERERERERES